MFASGMRVVWISAALVIAGSMAAVADAVRQNDCGNGVSPLGVAGWVLIVVGAVGTFASVRRQLAVRRWLALAPATIAILALLAAMGTAVIAQIVGSLCNITIEF